MGRSDTGEGRKSSGWQNLRVSVVVPIGVIVAVAILCVVVAVLGSARRADEVALDNERQLFIRSLRHHAERVLREVEGVATSEASIRRLRTQFDPEWMQSRLGPRLQSLFDQDFVFLADTADHFVYALLGNRSVDPNWFNSIKPDLMPALDLQRGRISDNGDAVAVAGADHAPSTAGIHRTTRLQAFLGRPAIVTAVAVAGRNDTASYVDTVAPVVLSVKFIDEDVLAEISSRLQLRSLRNAETQPATAAEYAFNLTDGEGRTIGRFAWVPKRPGAEIVNSVLPFIAVALAGFTFLAMIVFRQMRRNSATIAAGETRLRHLAMHDPLCGLPNRICFGERLESTIASVAAGRSPAAVLYIDLDHFKDVNDTLGHPIGDELIRAVTQRLTQTLRGDDLVARIGGDEFAVITTAGCDQATLQEIADRLIAALCSPYSISTHTIGIGASVGIAIITDKTASAADVLRHADMALYRAKNEGRNRACIYDDAMHSDLSNRKLIENDLRAAIERKRIAALLSADRQQQRRDSRRRRGALPLDASGARRNSAVRLHPRLPRTAGSSSRSANGRCGAPASMRNPGRGFRWRSMFRRSNSAAPISSTWWSGSSPKTDFDQTRLELEVTESTLLGNVDTTELAMFRLKALGVRLALDDFGTGYSSLLYLRRFPFDKLKIDRSFVHSIERAADAAAIVHAVVGLGRGLGMKVTAEGVETAEQHLFLRAAGVHSMQGYRFGRPGTAAEISARIAAPGSFRISDDSMISMALAG